MSGERLQDIATALSKWVDASMWEQGRSRDVILWNRVAKVGEESGEAISALIDMTGGNPRRPVANRTAAAEIVVAELCDTALAAIGAIEHMTGNCGVAMSVLTDHAANVATRAGVES